MISFDPYAVRAFSPSSCRQADRDRRASGSESPFTLKHVDRGRHQLHPWCRPLLRKVTALAPFRLGSARLDERKAFSELGQWPRPIISSRQGRRRAQLITFEGMAL
jgi:hypothetical protein